MVRTLYDAWLNKGHMEVNHKTTLYKFYSKILLKRKIIIKIV